MGGLPTGTVTFLFTDLEGSTRLWEQHPDAMRAALARHDELMIRAIEDHRGHVIKTTGDGFFAAFASASDGVEAAVDAQLALAREAWPETGELRVRMGLHTGAAELRDGDYHGPTLNRAARLMSVGHGGQVLVSLITSELVRDTEIELVDLGTHHLRDLVEPEHVFQVVHPELRSEFGALRTSARPAPSSNIPVPLDLLIGRTRELREVKELLRGTRLLTLLGTGGIGKTRLAIETARELCDDFDDRAYLVDLSGCTDREAVLSAITRTIGVPDESDGSLLDGIKERIGTEPMLLVLDNFEQVTTAASAVAELLRDCSELTALVTSREALNVTGEQVYSVPPLALPAEHDAVSVEDAVASDAVQLFVERARVVRADFELTPENAPAVVELCERLDGLPLAIELATARLALFTPQALVERLGNRLDLLTGGARDAPERQRALRDTIGWSHDLLTGDEQRLLALLAVFSGATIAAVEEVAARAAGLEQLAVLDGLGSLVAKSLLRRAESWAGAEPRVSMLETIRAFAAERLDEDADLRRRVERAHAEYFAEWAASRRESLSGDGRDTAAAVMAEDAENLTSAWHHWVREADFEQLNRLIDGLWPLYELRGWYFSTAGLIEDLLGVLASSPFTEERLLQQIRLQTSLARVLMASQGYTPETERAHQRALELCEQLGEVPQLVPVLRVLSSFYIYLSDFEQARRIGQQLLSLAERFDDNRARVEGHLLIGVNDGMLAELQVGIEHLDQGIAAYGSGPVDADRFQTGNDPGVVCHVVAGMLLWMAGFPDQAVDRADQAIHLAERLRHPPSSAYAHFHTGLIRMWRNEPVSALDHARTVVDISDAHELPVWQAVGSCLRGAAVAATGSPDEGLALFEAAVEEYRALKTPPVFWAPLLQLHAAVCGLAGRPHDGLALVDEALEVIEHDAGPQMSASELLTLKGQLLLARSQGADDPNDEREAEACFRRAVTCADEMRAPMLQLRATLALARLWARQGQRDFARELLQEAYGRITDGFATPDLVDAAHLLDDLTSRS